jgi:hypothetical protein
VATRTTTVTRLKLKLSLSSRPPAASPLLPAGFWASAVPGLLLLATGAAMLLA